jgi:hypothetical protein
MFSTSFTYKVWALSLDIFGRHTQWTYLSLIVMHYSIILGCWSLINDVEYNVSLICSDTTVVSFMKLPSYIEDEDIISKLQAKGIKLVSPVYRRAIPGTHLIHSFVWHRLFVWPCSPHLLHIKCGHCLWTCSADIHNEHTLVWLLCTWNCLPILKMKTL